MFIVLLLVTAAAGLEWRELRRQRVRALPAVVPGRPRTPEAMR